MSMNFVVHKPAQPGWLSVKPELHNDFYYKKAS